MDVTDLHVNQTLHVSELTALEGVEFLDDPDQPVITCVHGPWKRKNRPRSPKDEAEGAEGAEAGEAEAEDGEKEDGA